MDLKLRVFKDGKMYGHTHALTLLYKRDILLEDNGEFIIMLFTGLKDKKGVEIWEGDIVEAIMNYHGKETDVKFNAKIIYNSHIGAFQISYKNIDDRFVNDTIHLRYFLEVIGNIHENPELL